MPEVRQKVGLVGAGNICEFHIKAIRRLPNVELLGVTDLDANRAKLTSEKFGVKVFPSLQALKDAGATSIHVLTPPHTHAAVAIEALNMGCHVLVEKPAAEDVADCERIQALADEKGLKVCVNHSLLYDPQVKRAIDFAKSGKLGQVISVDILRGSVYPPFEGGQLPPQYRSAGYPFRDIGIHCLYIFQAFLGPVEQVEAKWSSVGGDPNLGFDEWRALVKCRDGMGQFQLSWNVKPMQSQIIIQGTKGVLRVDLFVMFLALRASLPLPKPAERLVNAYTDLYKPIADVRRNVWGFIRKKVLPYHGLQDLVKAFYASLESGDPVPVPIAEAIPVVDWVERVARVADQEHIENIKKYKLSESIPVLVTGASGAVGSAVVERLRKEGMPVRIFVRRPPAQVPEGVEIALGDLGDPIAVDKAVKGAQLVVHAGAAMKGGWIEHKCATVIGTQNVLEACQKHGVKKLVHISSMSVVDWAGAGDRPIDEDTALEPRAEDRGAYTRAKLEAEKLVVDFVKQHGLPTVILRPGQIFGGRIPLMTPAVARRAFGKWLVLGNGKVNLPLVHLDDVVDSVRLAMDGPLKDGEIIQIIDTCTLNQNEVLKTVTGGNGGVIRVPLFVVYGLGKFSEIVLGLLKRKSPLSVYRLKSALAVRTYKSKNAEALLGWEPRVGICEGIKRTIDPPH